MNTGDFLRLCVDNLVQTFSAVSVHTHASQLETFCWRCILTAGNTREGKQVNVCHGRQDVMQKLCCGNCSVFFTSC